MFEPILDSVLKYASQATRTNAQKHAHVFTGVTCWAEKPGAVSTEHIPGAFLEASQWINHSQSYIIPTGSKVPGLTLSFREGEVCASYWKGHTFPETQRSLFPNCQPAHITQVHIAGSTNQQFKFQRESYLQCIFFGFRLFTIMLIRASKYWLRCGTDLLCYLLKIFVSHKIYFS